MSITWYRRVIAPIPRWTKIRTFLFVSLFLALLFLTHLSMIAMFFWIFFIGGLLFHWDTRITIGGALLCIVALPILLIAKKDALAETIAVYAYYFLVIGVFWQIVEYFLERKSETLAKI